MLKQVQHDARVVGITILENIDPGKYDAAST
jgi:hypothetical protein